MQKIPTMAKEFKRSNSNDKDKKAAPKKGKPAGKDRKPAFERYRDESRPSDFGTGKDRPSFKERGSSAPHKNKPFDEKRSSFDKEKRPFNNDRDRDSDRKRKPFGEDREEKSTSFGKEKRSFDKDNDRGFDSKRKPSGDDSGEKRSSFGKEKRSFGTDRSPDKKRKPFGDKPASRKSSDDNRSDDNSRKKFDEDFYQSKPTFIRASDLGEVDYEQEYQDKKSGIERKRPQERTTGEHSERAPRPYKRSFTKRSSGKGPSTNPHKSNDDGTIRLNKYISNAGICSRREADDLISSGVIQVNGKVVTEMGYKVKPTDVIKYGGQTLRKERLVYLILNKPKDYITTVDDPQQRKTVLELVQGACSERIYSVGRLDRATTGLLMFTNDGELTKKLTHPRYGVRKIYHVELDKPLKRADMDQITEGIELEDGNVKVDEISYVGDGKDKASIGVEIHSGKNRIVRRIFEHFGYNVRKLDRVVFGPLTKKDMPRGRWRFLTDSEVGMLKMVSEKKEK